MSEKNVYQKLQQCRVDLQSSGLKQTGNNKFAGYTYFELGDFIPKTNQLFNDAGLIGLLDFGAEAATLTIVDMDRPEDRIVFSSPMSTAELKGCHAVQNLGAVETYIRRYLYTAAMEIVEADALNATHGKEDKSKPAPPPKKESTPQGPSDAQIAKVEEFALALNDTADNLVLTLSDGKVKTLAELRNHPATWTGAVIGKAEKLIKERDNA